MVSDPFEGQRLLADTSAWTTVRRAPPPVQEGWKRALREGRIVCCPVVQFELARGARNAAELEIMAERLSAVDQIHIQRSTVLAAVGAVVELAAVAPGFHRPMKFTDALIAAAASDDRCLPVLHYDKHFDRLARVLTFESRPIAPIGSI